MPLIESIRNAFWKVSEKTAPVMGIAMMLTLAVCFLTGQVSAAVNESAVVAYGLSLIDLILIVLGAIGFIVGLYLRHMWVILIGVILVVLAAVAYFVGL